MYKELYLEADEEVTSVIEKIKKAKQDAVAVILPRNAILGQSVINLKLLYKEAAAAEKQVVIITPDKTTQSLAERVGFVVMSKFDKKSLPVEASLPVKEPEKVAEAKTEEITKERFDEPKKDEEAKEEPMPDEDKSSTAEVAEAIIGTAAIGTEAVAAEEVASKAGFSTQAIKHEANVEESEAEEPDQPKEEEAHSEQAEESNAEPEEEVKTRTYQKTSDANSLPTRGNLQMFRKKQRRPIWKYVLALVVIVLIGGIAAALLIPTATVTATIATKPLTQSLRTQVDKTVTATDFTKAVIPGTEITVDQISKVTAKASGQQDVGTKATGTMTLSNGFDSNVHTLAAGTVIKASNGNQYTLNAATTIPGATASISGGKASITPGTIKAAVTASVAGPNYNLGPSNFTIVGQPFTASNSDPFSGGTTSIVSIATAADIAALTTNATKQLIDDATTAIKNKVTAQSLVYIPEAIRNVKQSVTTNKNAGDKTDSIEATGIGTFAIIAFKDGDEQKLLAKLLADHIPSGQQLVQASSDPTKAGTTYAINTVSENVLDLQANVQAVIAPQFDQNLILRSLIGSRPSEVQGTINNQVAATKVTTTITPSRWPVLPYNIKNIKLVFSYQNQ